MKCRYCGDRCQKKGIRNGSQSYRCVNCKKYQKDIYKYRSYVVDDEIIKSCVREGVGIRSMSRLLGMSTTTVLSRIKSIAQRIRKPPIPMNKSFEVDELITIIGDKDRKVCVVIALEKESGYPVDVYVGPRTKRTLRMVTNTLLLASPQVICTDGLQQYRGLIPSHLHKITRYSTNRVERFHLSLRTHLKRLNRRSIAYSRSLSMLFSCLVIYLWG